MKASIFKRAMRWPVVLPGLLMAQNLPAAVDFAITPPAVSNTYLGAITLQITGLAGCETVVVQRYVDVNSNGWIDGADFLWQQFSLTDGHTSVIGGVTNINVPGDTDPTPGRIAARVPFAVPDPGLNLVGRYAWRLSSPTGLFAPMTNAFTVTNAPYIQGLTGQARNNGTNVPNAFVLAFLPEEDGGTGWVVGSTVADNSGAYTLKLPAGTYKSAAFKSHYLGNLASPPVTLSNGTFVTADLWLSNTTQTISGRLVDTANLSVGLPGLLLHATAGGLVAGGNSDSNGVFTLPVVPGVWRFGGSSVEALGYVDRDSDDVLIDTTTGSVSGLVISYPKATALFYGRVKDAQGQPLAGVWVAGGSDDDVYDSDAFTDLDGNYVAGALGGNSWSVEVESDDPEDQPVVTGYLFSQGLYTDLLVGQAVQHDFMALPTTHFITGHLRDNTGNAISNVEIYASASIGGEWYYTEDETDTSGSYSLTVANGIWDVGVSSGGYPGSLSSLYWPPPNQEVAIANNNATVNFTSSIAPHQISGTIRDDGANPLPNVFVYASALIGETYYFRSGMTDGSGNYAFGVVSGDWTVGVDCDDLRDLGCRCVESQAVPVINGNRTADFVAERCQVQISTASALPEGEVNVDYQVQLQASGCDSGLYWSATNLPSGLELSAFGQLYGVPETCGSNYFVVQVRDDSGAGTNNAFSLVIQPPSSGSVSDYLVGKALTYRQTSPGAVLADGSQGPYNAYLWILPAPFGAVSAATCTLPNTVQKVFPSGCSALLLQIHNAFASAEVCDAAYPTGNYVFNMTTPDDGDFTCELNLPAAAFPDAPRIRNLSAAQAIHPDGEFVLQWDAFPGATADDLIRLFILDANDTPDFKLFYPDAVFEEVFSSDVTEAQIPSLETNRAYLGVLQFIRLTGVNDTGHPTAVGRTFISSQTVFPLATSGFGPVLSEPQRVSPTEFRFVLTGRAGDCYTIFKSTDLSSANWSILMVTNAPAESFVVLDPSATNRNAFYRAVGGQ